MLKFSKVLLIFFFAHIVSAQEIENETATIIARNFLIMQSTDLDTKNNFFNAPVKSIHTEIYNDIPVYHIVNFYPFGFAIVSASKYSEPIIGYSFNTEFTFPVTSPSLISLLENYKKQIFHQQTEKIIPTSRDISKKWNLLTDNNFEFYFNNYSREVQPLLSTTWNQGVYYNEFCPANPAGPNGHTVAGCVATALGQIMNYFRYPLSGNGVYTSEFEYYGIHTVDYENAEYRWNEMPFKVTRSNHAVAELLYHIGVSVDMHYGPNGSGMWNHKAAHTLKTFFGYSNSTQYIFRDTTTLDWNGILIEHLDNKIPLYYAGWEDTTYTMGHAIVCDGYQDSVYFHFNLGWGGSWDGYYHIDNLIVGGSNFTYMHEAVINAVPASNYPYYCSETDTIRTIDGTIEDGSGPLYNYTESTNCSWLISPNDTVNYITLKFLRFDTEENEDFLRVYDGVDENATLLGEFSGSNIPPQINSSGKNMFITFSTNETNNKSGFLAEFKAYLYSTCQGTVILTQPSGYITDGSGEYNYHNNKNCRWRIEPVGAVMFHISFEEFDIDSTDFVRILDIQSNPAQIIATLRGSEIPDDIIINVGKIMIIFYSNPTANAKGFSLNYQSYTSSIEYFDSAHILIHPNPASDYVNIQIKSETDKISRIDIYNIMGSLQLRYDFDNQSNSAQCRIKIPLYGLSKGLYFINIYGSEKKYYKKIIIY